MWSGRESEKKNIEVIWPYLGNEEERVGKNREGEGPTRRERPLERKMEE